MIIVLLKFVNALGLSSTSLTVHSVLQEDQRRVLRSPLLLVLGKRWSSFVFAQSPERYEYAMPFFLVRRVALIYMDASSSEPESGADLVLTIGEKACKFPITLLAHPASLSLFPNSSCLHSIGALFSWCTFSRFRFSWT